MKKQHSTNRGFTLIYALVVMAVVAVVSSTVYTITTRQLQGGNTTKQSELAYYAAEAAMECALFYTYDGAFTTASGNITCDEASIPFTTTANVTSFTVNFTGVGTCALVSIDKTNTTITAKGYNTCGTLRTKVERELFVDY